jgi:hypothetical protein
LSHQPDWHFVKRHDCADYQAVATQIEYPTVRTSELSEVDSGRVPHTLLQDHNVEYWDVTLEEAIRLALSCSKTLQDLGGTVLRVPDSLHTTYDPAITETNPQSGIDAALSAFDAQLQSTLNANKYNRRLNNRFQGANGLYLQDYDYFDVALSKKAATGSTFTLRKGVIFDNDNSSGNQFEGGAWDVFIEGEARHPLLRGGGVEYNRIAGPDGAPGSMNGVLLARVKTDVSLAEFEIGVRDLVSNVENAYWDLYYAFRDLDAKVKARDGSLDTWRRVHALYLTGGRGGEASKEAQAREQYFRFQQDVEDALGGRLTESTRTNNGCSAGTFRASPGVYVAERRLRLIVGLPMNDQKLMRPADEPSMSPLNFDWQAVGSEALARRPELRRQRWQVKARELELLASKNFLLPNLDLVGRYRFRGFGSNLIADEASSLSAADQPFRYDSAYNNLYTGRSQEWTVGAEFTMPLGFRQGHSAVRNAELQLVRDRCILREQELQVVHDLSDAIADVDRAYAVLQTNINRSVAAKEQLAAVQTAYDEDKVDFYVVLDAQRRYLDAETRYYQTRVDYAMAVRNVYYEKGTLLDDCGVVLNEGPWPDKAYVDAGRRERLRLGNHPINYTRQGPTIISNGTDPQ